MLTPFWQLSFRVRMYFFGMRLAISMHPALSSRSCIRGHLALKNSSTFCFLSSYLGCADGCPTESGQRSGRPPSSVLWWPVCGFAGTHPEPSSLLHCALGNCCLERFFRKATFPQFTERSSEM